jgi:hypothetical protein
VFYFNCKFDFCYACRYWVDYSFDGMSRQKLVNQALGNLVCLHHPGVVTLPGNGHRVLTTTWDHYWFASDGDYETAREQWYTTSG